MDVPQSIFDPAGPVARIQLGLLNLTLWFVIAIGIVVAAATVYIVWRFRDRKQGGLPAQVHGDTRLEIIWTIIPVIILVIIGVPTVRAAFNTQAPPTDRPSLKIRAEGVQWFWNFQYPEQGFTTSNELYVPVGRPVEITLVARDVIHSFWVPRLAGKVDLIPGRTNDIWFEADKEGVYWGQCAEFCGTAHAQMRFRVIAVSPEKFDAWVASHKNPVVTPQSDLAAVGEKLFMQDKGCFGCHTIDGTTAQGQIGPNLTGLANRSTIAAGLLENNSQNLKAWLRDPAAVKPGNKMPNLGLTEEEIDALVAFLQGLK